MPTSTLFPDEQSQKFSIPTFKGYNQAVDESQLDPGSTQNAQNFICRNGILEVTLGNTKYVLPAVPGGIETLMSFFKNQADGTVVKTLLAASPTTIYKWTGTVWTAIKTGLTSGRFSFINYQSGLTEMIILSNGVDAMFKWDGTTFADLGGTPYTPKGTSISLHYERVWVTGDKAAPNMVYFSKDLNPEFWAATDPSAPDPLAVAGGEIDIPTFDGGVNIGLSTIFDNVVIFKTYSLWKIVGTYPGEYQQIHIHSANGAIAERSIVDGSLQCYFLAMDGVYTYDGVKAYPISSPIKDIIKAMNATYRDKAVGVFYDNRYILAIPEGASTENNTVIEYDTLTQTWIIKRGFNVNDFLVYNDTLLFSNDAGYVLEYDKGNDFNGTAIVAYWDTPRTTLGSLNKTIRSTYFYADIENITAGGLTLTSTFDAKVVSTVISVPIKKGKRHRNKGRKIQLRFANIAGSRFRLRNPELHIDLDED